MEFLNSTISINPQISPAIPFLTWKSRKTPSRLYIPSSRKILLQPSFSLYSFRCVPSRTFQISARFGRPTNRQNYLRKKFTQQHQQQQVSHIQNPVHESNKFDINESKFDNSIEVSLDNESKIDSSSEDSKNLERSSLGNFINDSEGIKESKMESRKNKIGESIMWNKLENWVEQYKKDSEFWGIGSGPIFTIYQNSEGNVERVVVNEDEILRRSRVDPRLDTGTEDVAEVNFKISFAKDLAREMENGSNVIPKNSSVAKFLLSGGESRLMEVIHGVNLKPGSFSRMSRVGLFLLCGLFVVWAIRGLSGVREDNKEYTKLEKEMLRRKMKARTEKEKILKGSVEVMQAPIEPKSVSLKRPQLDKEELVNTIIKAKGSNSEPGLVECSGYENKEYKDKIEEIRAMARHAREIERRDSLPDDGDREDYQALKEFSSHSVSRENDLPIEKELYDKDSDETTKSNQSMSFPYEDSDEKSATQFYNMPNVIESLKPEVSNMEQVPKSLNLNGANRGSDGPGCQSGPHENSLRKKLRIIKSAKEAREYLSKKHQKLEVRNDEKTDVACLASSANLLASGNTSHIVDLTNEIYDSPTLSGIHDFSRSSEDYSVCGKTAEGNTDSLNDLKKSIISSGEKVSVSDRDAGISILEIAGEKEIEIRTRQKYNSKDELSSFLGSMPGSTSTEMAKHNSEDTKNSDMLDRSTTANEVKENWLEKNFHEFEPIVKKIGVGFTENYHVAREKASQEIDSKTELTQLKSDGSEHELEWMKDERLREIVFKVRDNELSGRDPFHLMDEEDKCAFFTGLEKKVEQENEKLLNLHEYFHSNIENLDYGADGISLYDPPEKIIPRWKVPPAEKNPEFLNNFVEQRKALFAKSLKNSFLSKKTEKDIVHKFEEPSSNKNTADVSKPSTELEKDNLASSKTIIEGSDGSVRAGKKSGKEYWQHTKKWSEGFLESYNAETEPEVKAVMRDMGKDLDRWITEKEIREAADLMDKIPEKGQKFIKQKLDKVKREMELFGAQAVVSKYREYAEEKEEDYLWWLDLPFVLCIEMYTVENGEQRVGFYSLEMAADLELDPKQYHVIAFEDAGDCKNLCYIIQAHMEMLGNGNAFVVARPPKDAFREAKANGFSVTVIRKGQLQLNIDQTLEEVEESIVEIGSKIYQDKIAKEHSVDINGLMKGVFGVSKPGKRKRSKRKLKRRIKP